VAHHSARPSLVTCEHQRFRVKRAYGPWYASGEWWSREAWAREEWEVILQAENAPVPMHALLVHDLVAQAWRVEGIYD
jgi:protein ImuB